MSKGRQANERIHCRDKELKEILSNGCKYGKGIGWRRFSCKRSGICCYYRKKRIREKYTFAYVGWTGCANRRGSVGRGEVPSGTEKEQLAIFRRRKIGFIFQNYNLVPDLNVYENVILPVELDGRKVDVEYVDGILELLGLAEKREALPGTLSGGQQQRAAIARALAAKPAIILADEPTGNLDSVTSHDVLGLLKMAARQFSQTLILITHDRDIAQLADRIVHIEDGKIVGDTRKGSDSYA